MDSQSYLLVIWAPRSVTVHVQESVSVSFFILMLVVVEGEDGLAKGVQILLEATVSKRLVVSTQLGFLVMLLLTSGLLWEKRPGNLYYE
jgi:hypothetical protein